MYVRCEYAICVFQGVFVVCCVHAQVGLGWCYLVNLSWSFMLY